MLKRLLTALLLSSVLVAADPAPAQAAPVAAAVIAFAATPIGGILVNIGIGFAVSAAQSLIQSWTGGGNQPTGSQVGSRVTLAASGIDQQGFNLGTAPTGGTLNYWGSWGSDGGTPNAYLTLEIILADMPMRRLTDAWVGDQRFAIPDMSGARPTPQGWPPTHHDRYRHQRCGEH